LGIEKNFRWNHFISHDKGIPDAQNYLFEQALNWGADYVWSVEEDNIFPPETFIKMVQELQGAGVVYTDYPIGNKKHSGICRVGEEIVWGPMGCTLISKETLEILPKPWFRTDCTFRIENTNPLTLIEEPIPNKYGGHDVYFGLRCFQNGIIMKELKKAKVGHIKPVAGINETTRSNSEAGEFEIWEKVEMHTDYSGPLTIIDKTV
jgi:hypothetical protein